MAVRIPTSADLGTVLPRAVGGLPQYPAEDPGAAATVAFGKGVATLGGALADIAADRQRKQNQVNAALAEADLSANIFRTKEAIKSETDPTKIDALKAQLPGFLERAGATITDPEHRQLWMAKNRIDVVRGEAIADERQRSVRFDRFRADASRQLDEQIKIAAQASDPEEREAAKRRIGQIIGSLSQSGAMTAEKAQAATLEAGEKIIIGHADWLSANGRHGEAQDFLRQNGRSVDPGRLRTYNDYLRPRVDKETGLGLLDRTAPGAPALGSSGDLWTRIKGAEGGVGRRGEALVSPKGAIGISQIIPETAREMAADLGLPFDEKRLHTDREYNEKLGKGYLDKMLARYSGNEALAAAAYNAGPHRVDAWLNTIGDPRKGNITDAEFASRIPFDETRNYVRRIIAGSVREGIVDRAPVTAVATDFDLGIGDSIAVQQIRHRLGGTEAPFKSEGLGPEGATARVGDSPQQVLDRIKSLAPKALSGKTIFLSSGTSNNPDQAGYVGDQIDALKKAGAAVVVVPGVGPGVKNAAAVNASLKGVVEEHGGVFFQPDIKWQKDGVHPAEVAKVREQAKRVLVARAGGGGVTADLQAEIDAAPAFGAAIPLDTVQPQPKVPDWQAWNQRIDAAPGYTKEQKEIAKLELRQRHNQFSLGQAEAASDLTLAVGRGEKGREDIEAAYQAGRISPEKRTQLHTYFDKLAEQRAALVEAMTRVGAAGNGGAPLDPKSKTDRDALSVHYDAVSKTWPPDQALDRAVGYAAQYGLVPEKLKSAIRGGLRSGRVDQAVLAAETVNRLRNTNPQLLGDIGDENDLRLATLISAYTTAGVPAETAGRTAIESMKVGKAEREARAADFDAQRGKSTTDREKADKTWIEGKLNSVWAVDPTVDPVMRREFEDVAKAEFERTGNLDAARQMALDTVNRVWGRSRVGGSGIRYMKLAPEKFYGVATLTPEQNSAWMNEQLAADVSKGAFADPRNPITADRLMLAPSPTTAPDGRPTYVVLLKDANGVFNTVTKPDGTPQVWVPDWTSSVEYRRQQEGKRRNIEQLRQQRVNPAPAFDFLFRGGATLQEQLSRGSGETP